ncbi:MAG: hypothetical protein HY879_17845 [Deltaproteobacteria bacterium]|nr:hypothetical protein [Deltaproteobacteria bacterium]
MRKFVEKECLPLERELCYKNPDSVGLPPDIHRAMVEKVKQAAWWTAMNTNDVKALRESRLPPELRQGLAPADHQPLYRKDILS